MLLAALFGAFGRGVVTISGGTIGSENPTGGIAAVRFNTDGTVDRGIDGGFVQINADTDWIRPTVHASASYELRCTVESGTLSSGTTDTWLAMDDNRTFSVVAGPGQFATATITIEIRIGGTVLASGVYTLSVNAQ